MLKLYENIRDLRTAKGMSQQELAELVGYTSGKSMIAKIESGLIDLPQSKIKLFAEALNTTPSDLMGWDDKEPELSTENAVLLADIMHDAELLKNVRKLSKLSPQKRAVAYSVIDAL